MAFSTPAKTLQPESRDSGSQRSDGETAAILPAVQEPLETDDGQPAKRYTIKFLVAKISGFLLSRKDTNVQLITPTRDNSILSMRPEPTLKGLPLELRHPIYRQLVLGTKHLAFTIDLFGATAQFRSPSHSNLGRSCAQFLDEEAQYQERAVRDLLTRDAGCKICEGWESLSLTMSRSTSASTQGEKLHSIVVKIPLFGVSLLTRASTMYRAIPVDCSQSLSC